MEEHKEHNKETKEHNDHKEETKEHKAHHTEEAHEHKASHEEHHEEHSEHKKHHEHTEHHEGHSEHKKHKKPLSKSFYTKLYVVLGVALVIFAFYNIGQISKFNSFFDEKIAEAKEASKPAEIELKVITTSSCADCYDIDAVVAVIESTGVNITSKEEIDFKEAKSLIDKYDIEKVPSLIISGEIDKSRSLGNKLRGIAEEVDGDYVFTKLEPPFIDASTGDVRGKISLIHLMKSDCEDCFDLSTSIKQFSESGLIFAKQEEIDVDSDEGKALVEKYDIEKVPMIIMDKEAEVYPNIVQSWAQLGTVEDGSFVMREISPPYYSIEDEEIKGLVFATFLVDKSCDECFDAEAFHKPVLQRIGVVLKGEDTVDISSSEGKSMIDKYNISKVPTIILSGDPEDYPSLTKVWTPVGTIEDDGAYIFRKVEIARKAYKDLIKDEVVEPAVATTS